MLFEKLEKMSLGSKFGVVVNSPFQNESTDAFAMELSGRHFSPIVFFKDLKGQNSAFIFDNDISLCLYLPADVEKNGAKFLSQNL